jgi:hypothetical protein
MQAQYRGMNLIVPDNDTEWKGISKRPASIAW